MNAFVLLLPFIGIRFIFLGLFSQQALKRAAYFAPLTEREKYFYYIYQLGTVFLLIYPIFTKVVFQRDWQFYIGSGIYLLGVVSCLSATYDFAHPEHNGMTMKGTYKWSRNPMYVGYFIYFLGMAILTRSIILFCVLLLFQFSAHWIILSEERWCRKSFGEAYDYYCLKVRRYL